MLSTERTIINQSSAARLRGVSRQRISELYSQGRFTVPTDLDGKLVKGAIYLDEVEALGEAKRGRPSLTEEQRAERGLDRFKVGDTVGWKHKPRDGYGYSIKIDAVVAKVGTTRVLLRFVNGLGAVETTWVNQNNVGTV